MGVRHSVWFTIKSFFIEGLINSIVSTGTGGKNVPPCEDFCVQAWNILSNLNLNPAWPEKSGPTYNSVLRLPRWKWPVMRLWRLSGYGTIMATLLLVATILESFWCSTMQSYQKLSTKALPTPALSRCSCIGPRASGVPAPWCSGRFFIFSRCRSGSRTQ